MTCATVTIFKEIGKFQALTKISNKNIRFKYNEMYELIQISSYFDYVV